MDDFCLFPLDFHFRVAFYAVVVVFCVEKRAAKVFCLSAFYLKRRSNYIFGEDVVYGHLITIRSKNSNHNHILSNMAPKKPTTKTTSKGKKPVTSKSKEKPTIKAAVKKTAAKKEEPSSKSYRELIVEGLTALKERKGSSRPALKKFIKENYPIVGSTSNFDLYFNNAIKKGVEVGDFEQPKGPSGIIKLNKKKVKLST